MANDHTKVNIGTIARMAGNIAAGLITTDILYGDGYERLASTAVSIARAIAAEIEKEVTGGVKR